MTSLSDTARGVEMVPEEATGPWQWEIAADADEVHQLLVSSDRSLATPENPAPLRNRAKSLASTQSRTVHLLRCGSRAVAMFTLVSESPFDLTGVDFPHASRPLYLQRLAIEPETRRTSPLAGVRALRRAQEVARLAGADAIRLETNPDLQRVHAMLTRHGFETHGWSVDADGRRRVYLQKMLA